MASLIATTRRVWILCVLTTLLALSSSTLRAQEAPPRETPQALDKPFSFGVYVSGWGGSYLGAGVGGRLHWSVFPELGIEVFGEGHVVEWQGAGVRHDHQVGFNVDVPISLVGTLRLRPLFGFCAVFSLVEPDDAESPRADDILFGLHGGLGLELGLGEWMSVFIEAQAAGWIGHDRSQSRWTGVVEDTYVPFGTAQLLLGTSVHFGD